MTIASGRFVSALALMLQSAVDPARSLELAARLVSHPALAARVEDCRRRLGQGDSFADSVRESGIFSGAAARMVGGRLQDRLGRRGDGAARPPAMRRRLTPSFPVWWESSNRRWSSSSRWRSA